MRRTRNAIGALCAVLVLLVCGCGSPAIHEDVVELRKLHAAYRSATVAREDLEASRVAELADKIDATFANLEELTR